MASLPGDWIVNAITLRIVSINKELPLRLRVTQKLLMLLGIDFGLITSRACLTCTATGFLLLSFTLPLDWVLSIGNGRASRQPAIYRCYGSLNECSSKVKECNNENPTSSSIGQKINLERRFSSNHKSRHRKTHSLHADTVLIQVDQLTLTSAMQRLRSHTEQPHRNDFSKLL